MSNFGKGFDCPTGFTEEEVLGQLYLEDLDEDCELWLIRMPSDIELSTVDKKKIFLGEEYSNTFVTEDGKIVECVVDNCEIPNLCAVLPEKKEKKLHAVKKVFKGSILMTEGLQLMDQQVVKSEIEDESGVNNVSDFLNSPSQSKKKNKKKKSKSLDDLHDSEEAENIDVSQVKKHSHSKMPIFSREIKNEPLLSDRDEFPVCDSQT